MGGLQPGVDGFTNRIKGMDSMVVFAAPESGGGGPIDSSGKVAEQIEEVELTKEELEKEILQEFNIVFPPTELYNAVLACIGKSTKKGIFRKTDREESTRDAIAKNIIEDVRSTMVESVSQDVGKTEFSGDVNKALRFDVGDVNDWSFNVALNPGKTSDGAMYEISQEEEEAIAEVLKKFAGTHKVSVLEHPMEEDSSQAQNEAPMPVDEPTTLATTSPFFGKPTVLSDVVVPAGGPSGPAKVEEEIIAPTPVAAPEAELAVEAENVDAEAEKDWESQYELAITKIEEMDEATFEKTYGKHLKPIEDADYRQVIRGMMKFKKEHNIDTVDQSEVTLYGKVAEAVKNLNTPGHKKKMVVVGNLTYWVDKEIKKRERIDINKEQEEYLVLKGNEFKKDLEAEYSEEILEQEFPGEFRQKYFELMAVIQVAKIIRLHFKCSGEFASKKASELMKYDK